MFIVAFKGTAVQEGL